MLSSKTMPNIFGKKTTLRLLSQSVLLVFCILIVLCMTVARSLSCYLCRRVSCSFSEHA